MARWLHDQELELIHALGFHRAPPRWGAFRKLLLDLDPTAFEAPLARWAEAVSANRSAGSGGEKTPEPIALDGKTVRGSLRQHRKAVHLLSAMAQRSGLTLIQAEVGDKTNERKAALPLLRDLVLKGRVVTADAIFRQRDLCRAVIKPGGHYFIAVKENQPGLLQSIQDAFNPPPDAAFSPSTTGPRRQAVLGTRHQGEESGAGRGPWATRDHAAERLPRLAGGSLRFAAWSARSRNAAGN